MPTYEYACPDCGSFTAVRPMAEYSKDQACPKCGAPAPRVTLTGPGLGLFSSKGAQSGGAGRSLQGCAHPGGCRCC